MLRARGRLQEVDVIFGPAHLELVEGDPAQKGYHGMDANTDG